MPLRLRKKVNKAERIEAMKVLYLESKKWNFRNQHLNIQ